MLAVQRHCSDAGIAGFCVRFCPRGDSGAIPPGYTAGSAVPPLTSRRSRAGAAALDPRPSAAQLACHSSSCADGGTLTSADAQWEPHTESADRTEPAEINPPILEEKHQQGINLEMQHSHTSYGYNFSPYIYIR